jgi:hypothetical protein
MYTHDLLKKFSMDKAKPIKNTMGTNGYLDLDMGGKSVDQKIYHSMIDSLLYLCSCRSDIMISVRMCIRFQAAPKECHFRAVKRIMRYLVLTPYLGLWYPKGAHFELSGYSDVDYAGCKVRKSTSETCQFLGTYLVRWSSKKQNFVPYLWSKQSMLQPGVVVHNLFGCDKLSWIMVTL